jgi:hypothetical protein
MRYDLMPEKIEVDPGIGAATFRAAKNLAIEVARRLEIVDRKSNMKGS